MSNSSSADIQPDQVSQQVDLGNSIEDVLQTIVFPACPEILIQLRNEIAADEPDPQRVSRLVTSDVALSLAVLRTINSPFYGLSRKVDSVSQAVSMIGLRQISTIVTNILMRNAANFKGMNLVRFWDVSTKRSFCMMKLAKELSYNDLDSAQSFGLFCDIGIPLLIQRFWDYTETLKLANQAADTPFTTIEFERHGVNHAQIGAMMGKAWGLSETLTSAIRRHHDYGIFHDIQAPESVSKLVAMCLVAELAIQRFSSLNSSNEWNKGGDFAAGALMLSNQDVGDLVEHINAELASGLD